MSDRDHPVETYHHAEGPFADEEKVGPPLHDSGPTTDRLRIAGVEAAVAAGLVPGQGPPVEQADPADPADRVYLDLDDDFLGEAAGTSLTGAGSAGTREDDVLTVQSPYSVAGGEMQDWRDPPTGQVPRILLDALDVEDTDRDPFGGPTVRGPVWRERTSDWDDDSDLSHLTAEGETLVPESSGSFDDEDPYDFDFGLGATPPMLDAAGRESRPEPPLVYGPVPLPPHEEPLAGDEAWDNWTKPVTGATEAVPVLDDARTVVPPEETRPPSRRHASRRPAGAARGPAPLTIAGRRRAAAQRAPAPATATATATAAARATPHGYAGASASGAGPGRNVGIAILTGTGIAVVGLVCFLIGSVATLALVSIVVALGAAECYGAFQRAGYRPATLLGLVATPAVVVAAYLKGPAGIVVLLAVLVVTTMVWFVAGVSRDDPMANIGATFTGFAWVGFLGAFGGLMLSPASFPHGHGVALLVGAIVPAVVYDIGAFAVGSRVGRHKLAPEISPGKSWEGLAGGTVAAILLAALVVSRIHPWHVSTALALGVVVSVVAPLGDLAESLIKRSLGLKDMSSLLPAHGGVLDRIDGLLFVLPATYLLVRALHIA